ncbi:MAG: multidrug transporter [Gammaproteobacteria bacterium]|nr:multidrug transporter [Gammaproteobacteria bacterium]
MSQYEVLNKDKHRQLRIKTGYGAALGDTVMYVMTFPMEFRDIQNCYPILFTKDSNTGGFFAAAVMGFEADQNLFLQDDGWDAAYVPALVQRQPFLIATGGEGDDKPPSVSLDLDHPRVSQDDGEALFDGDGNTTEFLDQKIALLDKLHRGLQHSVGFIDALLQHELLEQITLDIAFNDGEKKSLQGFYSIAEERLYQLKGDVLESLNQAGYLQPVFMAVASLSRTRDLIERRNRLRL